MTAAWMWARAELRARWRSWVVLGLLAGATAGIAAAGVAGARRTDRAFPAYVAASGGLVDAGVLANDPSFDAEQRAAVAAIPEVREALPFSVPFLLDPIEPSDLEGTLLPQTPALQKISEGVIVEGRHTDPDANEVVIDQNVARRFHLRLGSKIVIRQEITPEALAQLPPGVAPPGAASFTERLRVVGIAKSTGSEANWSPSFHVWDVHRDEVVGYTNLFIKLRHGEARFEAFVADVQRVLGHPVNVERGSVFLGVTKTRQVTGVESDGLLLFAFAVILGGGVLVGQALVRAVTASGAELDSWRAIGADRRLSVIAMALPAVVTAAAAAVSGVLVAIALSPRFPIGVARRYEIDLGLHADVLVLSCMVALVAVSIVAISGAAAWRRVTRAEDRQLATSGVARMVANLALPPSMLIGSRLAVEVGRGRRAVPVRSALVGALAGVLGVVACFTFRAGIQDASAEPTRSGLVWDAVVATGPGTVHADDRERIAHDRAAAAVTRALWDRAVTIDGEPVPTWGTKSLRGSMHFVVLDGRAPHTASEVAFAPTTATERHVDIGDRVRVGSRGFRVVGIALLPESSHTAYDEGAWVTLAGLRGAIGEQTVRDHPDRFEDYQLIRWREGANVHAALSRMSRLSADYNVAAARLPTSVADLGNLATMPLVLAVFFGLLACATVAHALVTTVRRRRFDVAILRSVGFTRRQSRLAIAWQAALLAIAGLVVGVPFGLAAGRALWRWVAEDFPVAYVPPVALVAIVLVVPVGLLVGQALAAGPGIAASRIRPAEALRVE